MQTLPKKYEWLLQEQGPKMITEFLKIFGTAEVKGVGDNPVILGWAKELGIKDYTHDSIAWCGLEQAIVATRAGKQIPVAPLWALNWLNFGIEVPIDQAMFGDTLVFKRTDSEGHTAGHVALYIAEDKEAFHAGGGNTSDMVTIARIVKSRCVGVRRPLYNVTPANIRKIFMGEDGPISQNEQ